MAALTALAIAGGLAAAGGAYESYEGSQQTKAGYEQQQQGIPIQQQAAQEQAGIYKQQAASSVVYAGQERDLDTLASQQSITAANQSHDINAGIIQNEQTVQAQQQQAMELDARRQSLEIIRNQQRGRSLALSTAVAQGGSGGIRSSALAGGYGQVSGQTGVNLLGVSQNLQIGENIFAANNAISSAKIQENDLETAYSIQQANNQTAKSNLAYGYAQTNAGYQTQLADTQTLMSQGQGIVNQGSGMIGQGQATSAFGGSLISAGSSLFSAGMNFNTLSGGSTVSNLFQFNSMLGGGSPSGYGK
jgi:hypothetical protein